MVDVKEEVDEPSKDQIVQTMMMLTRQIQTQNQQLQAQNEAIQVLLKERNERETVVSETSGRRGPSVDALEKQIRTFSYRPEDGLTFDNWMERHREIFENDFSGLEDGDKGRILLRKVDDKADKQFRNHIRPRSPAELKFDEIVSVMKELFGDRRSQFEKRLDLFQLKMSKLRCDDLEEFSSIVNRVYEDANISEMKPEEVKAMILLSGIDLPRYTSTLFHVMNQIGDETPTMDTVLRVADTFRKVYGDAHAATNQSGQSTPMVNAVSKYNPKWHKSNRESASSGEGYGQRRSYCSRCGRDEHTDESCPHLRSQCFKCDQIGHLSNMCNKWNRNPSREGSRERKVNLICSELTDGIDQFKANVEMNGRVIEMLVDTGSDVTLISESSWREIGAPKREVHVTSPKCANGTRLKLTGRCTLTLGLNGNLVVGEVYTSKTNLNILGRNFVSKFFRLVPNEIVHSRVEARSTGLRDVEVKGHSQSVEMPEGDQMEAKKSDSKETKIEVKDRSRDQSVMNEDHPIEQDASEIERMVENGIIPNESVHVELSTEGALVMDVENGDGVLDSVEVETSKEGAVRRSTRNRNPPKRLNDDSSKKSCQED